jgi:hypothetical protein
MAEQPRSPSDKQKVRSAQIEAQILEAEKQKANRQFLEELGKRISIAREGRTHIEKRNYPAAMVSYRRFLTITAKNFDVEIPDLAPALFDEKNRVAECLIMSSVFFDLLKMLDRLATPTAAAERQLYQKLFQRFTRGMPFQHFAAENLRKHLMNSRGLLHKKEFWATYHSLAGKSFCLVATWAFDSSSAEEVVRLRRFRDEVLLRSGLGRMLVRAYYRYGHRLALALAKIPGSRRILRASIRAALSAPGRLAP